MAVTIGPSNITEQIPDKVLSNTRRRAIDLLEEEPELSDSDVASLIGCSSTSVGSAKQIVSAFFDEDEVEFDIPTHPSWYSYDGVVAAISHNKSKYDSLADTSRSTSREKSHPTVGDGGEDGETALEILGRALILEQGVDTIAEDMDLSKSKVSGHIGAQKLHDMYDEDDFIVPDKDFDVPEPSVDHVGTLVEFAEKTISDADVGFDMKSDVYAALDSLS